MFEPSVDRLGWSVAGAGSVEVGQDIVGALLQRSTECDELAERFGYAVAN